MLQIEEHGLDAVSVTEVLLEMRTYRMGLIQTPDQLRFSYQAIIEGARQQAAATANTVSSTANYVLKVASMVG